VGGVINSKYFAALSELKGKTKSDVIHRNF